MKITPFIKLLVITLAFKYGGHNLRAQEPIKMGLELDVLPYLTGGYFGAVWAGKNHVRARALFAKVNMPDFVVPDGFTNNTINAYALLLDYFLKENQQGIWFGGGLVLWDGKIQSDLQEETASYQNFLLNGSMGYNINLSPKFYLSPWGGISLRVDGDKDVDVDDVTYNPNVFNPEISIKLGYRF